MRAVVDVNVLISAVLSSRGAPAGILRRSRDGGLEIIVSPLLLQELARAFAYPKVRKRVPAEKADAFGRWLSDHATVADDPPGHPPIRSPDPGDDYLIALAVDRHAYLVTGDQRLLTLKRNLPIHSPAEFLAILDR